MKKLLCLLGLAAAVTTAGCYVEDPYRPVNGDYYGSAYYYVEEYDYIIDQWGYSQTALCTGDVLFSGWFDAACDALISSEPRYADLFCDYYDEYGYYHSYYQEWYFPRSYIAEYCSYGKPAQSKQELSSTPTASTEGEPVFDSNTQPEVKDGQIHAIVSKRVGKRLVEQRLGKNVTIEEVLKSKGALKRHRTPGKEIQKIVTEEEAATK